MNQKSLFFYLFALLIVSSESSALEKSSGGFFYPTGRAPLSSDCGWLASGSAYQVGLCHIGHDFRANFNDPVYPICDGEVLYKSEGGWEGSNVALLIKHTLSNNQQFIALYGHIIINVSEGDKVYSGIPFAQIGWLDTGCHLHFGILPGVNLPEKNGWGKFPISTPQDTNGFVDPINWLNSKSPKILFYEGLYGDKTRNQAILTCFNNLPSSTNKGSPIDNNGGGIYVHDWNGVTIQDFGNSGYKTDGMYAIVYNGNMNQAFQIKEGFWGVYKPAPVYYCPINAVCYVSGPEHLGAPRENEKKKGEYTEQEFEKGSLRWDSNHSSLYLKWKEGCAVSPAKNNEWYRLFAPWETSDEHARVSRTLLYELNSEIKILPAKKTGRNSVHLLSEGKIILSWQIESPPTGGTTFLSYSTNGIDFSFLYLYH